MSDPNLLNPAMVLTLAAVGALAFSVSSLLSKGEQRPGLASTVTNAVIGAVTGAAIAPLLWLQTRYPAVGWLSALAAPAGLLWLWLLQRRDRAAAEQQTAADQS